MIKKWDWTSELYNIFRHRFPFHQILEAENQNLRKLLHTLAIQPDIVVDLGSGHGNALRQYQQFLSTEKKNSAPPQMIALDFSFGMLQKCKIKNSADPVQANLTNLPFRNNSISLVLMIGVAEYLENSKIILCELKRILKPGGEMVISISPLNWLFYLRFLLGKKLFKTTEADFASRLTKAGLLIKQKLNSLTQIQYLVTSQQGTSFLEKSTEC